MVMSGVEASQLVYVHKQPDDISRMALKLKPIMLQEIREAVRDDL